MQLLEPRRSPRRRKRWTKITAAILLAVLAVGGWQAWEKGRPRYLRWKQQRALAQAREFIAQRDAPNAQLALEVALKTIPGNPDTIRVAADLLEQIGSPQAMRLRRAVAQIVPNSAEDAAALVYCCLQFRDINAARDALGDTPPHVSSQPPMLHAALTFALTVGDAPVAEVLFEQLKEIAPNDQSLEFSYALFHLRHPDPEQRQKAKQQLDTLAGNDPKLQLRANRELAALAIQEKNYPEAKSRLKAVLTAPDATFTDRLQKANLDLLVDQVPFDQVFGTLSEAAEKSDNDAVQFVRWLIVQNRAAEADRWLNRLPETIRGSSAVKSVRADIASRLGEWDRLNELLADGAWGPISKDTLRLAFAAHTINNPAKPSLRRETWEMTLSSAGTNFGALHVLQRLSAIWQWHDELEQTLWAIARTFPHQTWAHQSLFDFYREKRNTVGMRNVMGTLRDSEANVPRYQYDWALLALLTEPSSKWNPAKEALRKLYESDRRNPSYATGYAFALAQSGKSVEAYEVISKLSPEERDYPPRQPYLAFVFGVAKKADDFERTVEIAQNLSMLPEESYLFVRAREELTRKPAPVKETAATSAKEETSAAPSSPPTASDSL